MKKTIIAIILTFSMILPLLAAGKANTVRVPDVIGMKSKGAVLVLENAGLRTSVVVVENKGEPGTVVRLFSGTRQFRAWEAVSRGTHISVGIVKERLISVPDLTGKSEKEASEILLSAGLRLGKVTAVPTEEQKEDFVFKQNPIHGTEVEEETAVSVSIAKKVMVQVPETLGLQKSEAEKKLIEAGLNLGSVLEEEGVGVNNGAVIRQEPTALGMAEKKSPVNLVIAKEAGVSVPYLAGCTKQETREKLIRANLTLGAVEERVSAVARPGTVIEQNPPAYKLVSKGTPVIIVTAKQEYIPVKKTVIEPTTTGFSGPQERIKKTENELAKARYGTAEISGTSATVSASNQPIPEEIIKPYIRRFRALKSTLEAGESSLLRWEISGLGASGTVTLFSVNNGIEQILAGWKGPDALKINEYPVTPGAKSAEYSAGKYNRVVYRLKVENAAGSYSQDAVFYVFEPERDKPEESNIDITGTLEESL